MNQKSSLKEYFLNIRPSVARFKGILTKIPGIEDLQHTKLFSFAVFAKTVGLALAVHCYDYITDCWLIMQIYESATGGEIKSHFYMEHIFDFEWIYGECIERIPDLVNATSSEIGDLSIRNTFSFITFLSFLLVFIGCFSLLLIIPQLPTLKSLYNISKKMVCSVTEKKNTLDSAKVLNRFNFSRSEP